MKFRRCGLEYFLPTAVAMLRTPVPVTAAAAVSPRIPLRLMKVTGGRRTARRGRRRIGVVTVIAGVGIWAAIVGYFFVLG